MTKCVCVCVCGHILKFHICSIWGADTAYCYQEGLCYTDSIDSSSLSAHRALLSCGYHVNLKARNR